MRSRLPPWFRRPLPPGSKGRRLQRLLEHQRLQTVCEAAQCPNRPGCWEESAAAFLLLGPSCTRACRFCAIGNSRPPAAPDPAEPRRIAAAAAALGLRHVVLTSVTRDDLPDGGAAHFAATIRALRQVLPEAAIEVLTPDFQGEETALATVLAERPDIFNHNLETVERLQPAVRPQADYGRSLGVLRRAAAAAVAVKSGLMLGLGETAAEVEAALRDLRSAGVSRLSLGQYLPPSPAHFPLARYVSPEEFAAWRSLALALGFTTVAAGPQVRSSYQAAELPGAADRGRRHCAAAGSSVIFPS